MSGAAVAAARAYYDESLESGDVCFDIWMQRVEAARATVARCLGAAPDEIAFVANASAAMNLVALMLTSSDTHVLSADGEFPSATLPWLNQGARLSFLPRAADGSIELADADALIQRDTRVFVGSHVQYQTGFRYDLGALSAFCEARRLALVVDATQSVGAQPIDVQATPVDALLFSGYKWAGAGYGVGVLYMPQHKVAQAGLPVVGWRSTLEPALREYDTLNLAAHIGAVESGHPAFASIFALGESLSLLHSIGIAAIAERVDELTVELQVRLDEAGFELASPRDECARSSITLIQVDDASRVQTALYERGVFVSEAGGRLRVSVHFYNNHADIEQFMSALMSVTQ